MTLLLVAAGGGFGAGVRYWLAVTLDEPDRLPVGTLLVNLLASYLLGVLLGRDVGGEALALCGTGFCGGLSTYSTFAVQTVDRGRWRGAGYAALTIVASIGVAALGFAESAGM